MKRKVISILFIFLVLEWRDNEFPEDERFARDFFLKDIIDLEEAGMKRMNSIMVN